MATSSENQIDILVTMQNQATAELNKLNASLGQSSAAAQKSGSFFSGLGGTLLSLGIGYETIKHGIVESIQEFAKGEEAVALFNATLKSTGGVAGVTTQQAYDLANSLQWMTKYSDDDTMSMEGLLLTFTKINKDIFPETVNLVQDISTRMGQDLKSSAIQVGKALQDPILGMTALRRIGVNFNATDKEMVTQLVQSGQGLKAQKYILHELTTEFGGAAKAAGETFSGRLAIAQHAVAELQKGIGGGLVNALYTLTDSMSTSGEQVGASIEKMKINIANYVSGFVIGWQLVAKEFWDVCNLIGTGLFNVGNIIASWVSDVVNSFSNVGKEFSQLGQVMNDLIHGDFSAAMKDYTGMMSTTFTNTNAAIDEGMKNSTEAFNAFSNDATDAMDKVGKSMALNAAGITSDTKAAGGAMKDFGEAAKDAAAKTEEASKKIAGLKQQIKDLNKEFKQQLSNLKETFNTNLASNSKDEAKNVADQILAIQADAATQQDNIKKATTQSEIDTAKMQLAKDQQILALHVQDYITYADAIKQQEAYNNMDTIDQAKYTAAQQAQVLLDQYNEDVKNAKKAHDTKLKELKSSLKEAEKEYKKFFNSIRDMEEKVGSVTVTSKFSYKAPKNKLATGTNYVPQDMIAMIHEGEAVVPKQYNPAAGGSDSGASSYVFNLQGAMGVDAFVEKITGVINRKNELRKLGSTT